MKLWKKKFNLFPKHWGKYTLPITVSMAGKIRFSSAQKSMLLKASSGEHCVPCNFVHLLTLRGTCICLIVYLVLHQIKYVRER